MIKDAIEFFKLIGFIEMCDQYDLSAGPQKVIDVYNESVVKTEELAKKHNLYDEEQACNDVWYHLYTLWPVMKNYFQNIGGDKMNIKELRKADEEKVKEHFQNSNDWIFDQDLKLWFNMSTNQTIREYLLDNVETLLSPNELEEFTSKLIFDLSFYEIVEEMSNVELFTVLITTEKNDNKYKTVIYNCEMEITPKQWRKIVDEGVERFIMGKK